MMFYLLVVGSRTFDDYELLCRKLDRMLIKQSEVTIVSGCAKGADELAERYAKDRGYEFVGFPADWNKHGKSAGYIRNEKMHKYISQFEKRGVVAFWNGKSKGTQHNFELAKRFNNKIIVVEYEE